MVPSRGDPPTGPQQPRPGTSIEGRNAVASQSPVEAKTQGVRRAQAAQTEAALKQAALVVFARNGYLNTKIVDITREAGRSAGSFYTYFPSKEALLESLLTDLLAEADGQVGQAAHSEDFSDRAAVRWHVALYWDFAKHHRTVLAALRQAATVDDGFARRVSELGRADLAHMADHLRVAQRQGVQLPGDPEVVATAIAALMSQFAERRLGPEHSDVEPPLSDDEAIETLTSFIARGIGIRDS
jgi:AcrR family transcriptional regulator